MTTIPKEAIKAAAKALRDFLNPEYGVYPVEQPTTAQYMHEAEVALAAALPHLQGWQPVETAPKDGSKFLSYTIHGEYEIGEFYKIETDSYILQDNGLYKKERVVSCDGWNVNKPAFWQPLPPPPGATS